MKIALFLSDGLIGHVTLNNIVPQILQLGIQPIIVKSRGPNIERAKIPELKELSFLETDLLTDVVEPVLDSLPVHQEYEGYCYTTRQLIDRYNIEYVETDDVNDHAFISELFDKRKVDGGISLRFYPIFKSDIIDRFNQNGFLWNMHTGLLPKYKGVFIPYHSIENNEKYYGWTLHQIARKIDTGDIIAIDKLPLDRHKPVLDTYLDMTEKGAAMIMGALMCYQKYGELKGLKQITDRESYFTYPMAQEMDKWNRDGIIFSNDIIETYVRYFTAPETVQETLLRNSLLEATAPAKQHAKVA